MKRKFFEGSVQATKICNLCGFEVDEEDACDEIMSPECLNRLFDNEELFDNYEEEEEE